MSSSPIRKAVDGGRFDVSRTDVALWAGVLTAEALVILAYLAMTTSTLTEPRYAVYPFVWINLGLLAVSRTTTRARRGRVRLLALGVTAGYLLVLLSLGGVLQFGPFPSAGAGTEFRVSWALPGWGPLLVYRNSWLQAVVVPFKLVGYFSFAYLLYARLLDATAGVLSGVFGVVSCVGCTFSVLVPLLGASTFSAIAWLSWDLSTLVFVVTIALLYWGEEIGVGLSRTVSPTPLD
ncbi:DUF7546 family protein [Halolamina sp. C58]|uniref:DUF7546 family protein n=1 Tax=Halolamina sp. C58 TaxID=3421640 RepID=UPI003EB8256F